MDNYGGGGYGGGGGRTGYTGGSIAQSASGARGGGIVYDGKRMRKPVVRKTVDYNATISKHLHGRLYRRDWRQRPFHTPCVDSLPDLEPPFAYGDCPSNAFCSKYVQTSVNKSRRPVNSVVWTPDGRRLLTGTHSGEFTLWNGLQFNFETILQAHAKSIRCMKWSGNGAWMLSADDEGIIKYWQTTMNNVREFQGHSDPVRGVDFAPNDGKFVSCADDKLIKIWDFVTCTEEQKLIGHGWDVKSVSWHPHKSLVLSGGKDNMVMLWDVKSGNAVCKLNGHKNTVSTVSWNPHHGINFLTTSRDQLVKVWDIRTMSEVHSFRGHNTEVTCAEWHPEFESMFATGDFEGNVKFWVVGYDTYQGEILGAHESGIWDMAWHPLGNVLVTGSNDQTTKFWARNRPGDEMRDKYNVLMLPSGARNEAVRNLLEASKHAPGGRQSTLPIAISQYDVTMEEEEDQWDKLEEIPGLGNATKLMNGRRSHTRRDVATTDRNRRSQFDATNSSRRDRLRSPLRQTSHRSPDRRTSPRRSLSGRSYEVHNHGSSDAQVGSVHPDRLKQVPRD